LNHIAFTLDNTEYEPNSFPGLVYRMVNPKVTFLIFGSGRIICTGAKTITDLKESVEKLYKNLKKLEK